MNRPSLASNQKLPFKRQKIIGFAVLFVLLSVLVPFTIQEELNGQGERLWNTLINPWVVVSSVALLALYYLSDALRLWFTLRALGQHQPLLSMFPLVFINILFSNITPMATGGGMVQVWFLHRRGIHIGAATAATTLRTLLASLMIFLPAPFLIMGIDRLVNSPTISAWAPWMGLCAALYVGFFVILLLRLRWFMQAGTSMLSAVRRARLISPTRERRWKFRLRKEMIRFDYSFRAFFKANRTDKLLAIVSTATFLVTLFSFPALLMWGLGYTVDYPLVLALMVVNTFIMYFAPAPGAAGIAEGVFALLFASLTASGNLVVLILAWRFLTIHLGMLIGVPLTLYALSQKGKGHA